MEWTKFNMNDYCKVLPNERGKESFIKEWMATMTREQAEQYFKSKLDKDGYMTLQLWCAFEYFGSSMGAGEGGLHPNEFYLATKSLRAVGEKI
jgi:hypothetical protein